MFPALVPDFESPETEDSGPIFSDTAFSLLPLWQLRGKFEIAGEQVKARGIEASNLSFSGKLRTGTLKISSLAFEPSGGAVMLSGIIAARDPDLIIQIKSSGQAVPSEIILAALEIEPLFRAPLDFDIALSGRGNSLRTLVATLTGGAQIVAGSGMLEESRFVSFEGGILREIAPFLERREYAKVNCAVSGWSIDRGVAATEGLLFDTELMSVSGNGNIDLGQERFDMVFAPRPKEPRLLDLALPVHLRGTLRDPVFEPTATGIGKKVLTTLGVLVNPLVLLVPVIEGATADKKSVCGGTCSPCRRGSWRRNERYFEIIAGYRAHHRSGVSKRMTKRFYQNVTVAAVTDGHEVRLDDRPVRTPLSKNMILPAPLAEAVAQEWATQPEKIDPMSMVLTQLSNAAIDHVTARVPETITEISRVGESDLLCYRAESPSELVSQQQLAWQPWLEWAAEKYGARLQVTNSILPVKQNNEALASLRTRVASCGRFSLTGLRAVVPITGSLVLGLAVLDKELTADDAWALSRLEAEHQVSKWGEDEEAKSAADAHRAALQVAVRFLDLSAD